MKVLSLLRKEVLWSRHRVVALLFLLLVLPGCFAFTTVAFETAVPEDAPIAIVPENENVSEDGLAIIEGGAALFSDPKRYEEKSEAMRALRRESVYAVLEVPPGILNENTENATFSLYIDGSVVPFQEPSKAIESIVTLRMNENLPANVSVERQVVGNHSTFSEYLVPVFLMGFVLLFAFTYLPHHLAREADVLERLLVETSMDAVVATKILFMTALMLGPISAFYAVSTYLGYSVTLLTPAVVGIYLLTFVYMAAISTSVMILTDFSRLGRFLNVAIMLTFFTFSSVVHPVGFFSPLRKEIARQLPLHYSMIVARGLSLKELGIGLFADWILGLLGFTLVTLVVLKLSIERYKRTA
ncbi:ABC transporter permease [Halorientalis salina]|uniref:ABC transporter permease n=1 Tax=Halorientalis salina TaxID=2932266 RepID=UPI0010AD7B0F|nr:ABC transporter permease [Halorientalis salina]